MSRELTQRGEENPKVCRSGGHREQLLPPALGQSTRGRTDLEARPVPPERAAYLGCLRRTAKSLAEGLLAVGHGRQTGSSARRCCRVTGSQLGALVEDALRSAHWGMSGWGPLCVPHASRALREQEGGTRRGKQGGRQAPAPSTLHSALCRAGWQRRNVYGSSSIITARPARPRRGVRSNGHVAAVIRSLRR